MFKKIIAEQPNWLASSKLPLSESFALAMKYRSNPLALLSAILNKLDSTSDNPKLGREYFGKWLREIYSYLKTTVKKEQSIENRQANIILNNLFQDGDCPIDIVKDEHLENHRLKVNICGHENPDLDSVISTIALSWMLFQNSMLRHARILPSYFGKLSPYISGIIDEVIGTSGFTTKYLMQRNNFNALVRDVMTIYYDCYKATSNTPLHEALDIMNERNLAVIPIVGKTDGYLGCLRKDEFAKYEKEMRYNIPGTTTIKDYLVWRYPQQLKPGQKKDGQHIHNFAWDTDSIDKEKFLVNLKKYHSLPVLSRKTGNFVGIITAEHLTMNGVQNILLDTQTLLPGMSYENLAAIIDHHKLKGISSLNMDTSTVKVCGSTVSLIAEKYLAHKHAINIPQEIIYLMLIGILDDTDFLQRARKADIDIFRSLVMEYCKNERWRKNWAKENHAKSMRPKEFENRISEITAEIKILLEKNKQSFYQLSLQKENYQELITDYKYLQGVYVGQVKVNKQNHDKFNRSNFYNWFRSKAGQNAIGNTTNTTTENSSKFSIFIISGNQDNHNAKDQVVIYAKSIQQAKKLAERVSLKINRLDKTSFAKNAVSIKAENGLVIIRYPFGSVISRKDQVQPALEAALAELNN